MLNSPNKHTSLDTLEQIKADNYIGKGGVEYASTEVDQLIIDKKTAQANAMRYEFPAYDKSIVIPDIPNMVTPEKTVQTASAPTYAHTPRIVRQRHVGPLIPIGDIMPTCKAGLLALFQSIADVTLINDDDIQPATQHANASAVRFNLKGGV